MHARNEILSRIRSAIADAPAPEPVSRDYHRKPLSGPGDVELFAHTVDDYRAQVHRADESTVTEIVTGLIAEGARAVVPPDLPQVWRPRRDVVVDGAPAALSTLELDAIDVVVTGCTLGIAATGTVVLDGGAGQGRRALTLVPDHHICVIRADQIVDTVPQAFQTLDATKPLTFISGPSATSDIELNRVEGVHGPRTLDVVIVR
ncbi:LutC/YkgG family protein [Rhodococcus tibetensis]|uniref:Lactate utilization protein C n=1 Tax=Rhodococcus tibetensis TaxID=2965064 RepID=A0ABT1QBL5_9NOCA|nr:lactate utilization protein C [Rhodococcus sp. FXJ9.536]MCQ4119661.1 lactate utilization protein C [Rhodococcus sp. FXJ9.536]